MAGREGAALARSREVLEAALASCLSTSPHERMRGADILGQLGVKERAFPEERFRALERLLLEDEAPEVLAAAAHAMGHLGDDRGTPALVPLAGHPHGIVRFGVACALGGREQPEAVAVLLRLMEDADEDVRDWATFGLGDLSAADGLAIRDALLRRLDDPCDGARFEDVCGLAKRRDERVAGPLFELLANDPDHPALREAAHELLGGAGGQWPTGELLERLRGAASQSGG